MNKCKDYFLVIRLHIYFHIFILLLTYQLRFKISNILNLH